MAAANFVEANDGSSEMISRRLRKPAPLYGREDEGGGPIPILAYGDNPLMGTDASDFLLAQNTTTINGLGGDDLILGDIGLFHTSPNGNTSFANAVNLDFAIWSVDENPMFADDAVPHTTFYVLAEAGTQEYFQIVIGAGQTITIDIDAAGGTLGSAAITDTVVDLFAAGELVNPLASNDDSTDLLGGQGSVGGFDSFLTFTNTGAAGTFYIRIREFGVDGSFEADDEFLLNISLTGHSVGNAGPVERDFIDGGSGNDHLFGGAGNDVLTGGPGNDVLVGGTGVDEYIVEDLGDRVVEVPGEGDDRVFSSVNYILAADSDVQQLATMSFDGTTATDLTGNGIANRIIGNAGANTLRGEGGDDYLFGWYGNDVLIGGAGADSLQGGGGNDIYHVDENGDSISELTDQGDDRVLASASYVLTAAASVETMFTIDTQATTPINLTGNTLQQVIYGNEGANILDGGGGGDLLEGEGGNDTFIVRHANDRALEEANEGDDRVYATVSYTLGAGESIELLATIDSQANSAIDLAGNQLNNRIEGNNAANVLHGWGGNDVLIGGGGADVMVGGTGDDTYYFEDLGDAVSEFAGEGNDRIAALISLALASDANVERIEAVNLTSTAAMDLTGSAIGNVIYGNDGVNILRGEAGNDELRGFGGDDFLVGGAGTDLMVGGAGNDTFYVDDASDAIGEIAGQGNDRIAASVAFVLSNGADVEILEAVNVAAATAFDVTGSDSANTITGNAGSNILRGEGGADILNGAGGNDFLVGGAGNDAMSGGTGNDTFYVDAIGDVVNEFAGEGGLDRVVASASFALSANADVELLETATQGGTTAINLIGSSTANTINGNDGANLLDGRGGSDTLTGFGGADTFQFSTALGAGNVDWIVGFITGADRIALDDAIFTAIGPVGALNAGAFFIGSAAHEADDRIIYNQATGALLYDADGDLPGVAAVQFATLSGNPALAASDFLVI